MGICCTSLFIFKAEKSTKSDKDVLNSVWYNEGLTRIHMAFGSAYKNENGKAMISASGILRNNFSKTRVISAEVSLDKISIIVNSLIEMDNAEAFLIDNNDKDSDILIEIRLKRYNLTYIMDFLKKLGCTPKNLS